MIKRGAARRVRKMSVYITQNQGMHVLPSNCRLRNTNQTSYITEEQSAAELLRQSWLRGSSVRQKKKYAVMLMSTSVAHLVINSSKKYLPSYLKLFSLNTA